jgi:phosphoserine phosphatase
MTIDFVIFDMDGVIFEGRNFWLDLHRHYATEVAALSLAERYLKDNYETLAQVTAEKLWKGRSAEPFFQLVSERRYQDGVVELFDYLRRARLKTAIVSSGPFQLASRAQRDLGIDEIRANKIVIVDGRISGRVEIQVNDSEKKRVSLEILKANHVAPENAAAVGDTASDVELAAAVGLAIAYDSVSAELDRIAHLHLRKGEILRLVEMIDELRS